MKLQHYPNHFNVKCCLCDNRATWQTFSQENYMTNTFCYEHKPRSKQNPTVSRETTRDPIEVREILETWLLKQQITQDSLRAFHEYPDNPELLTAWVDSMEDLETLNNHMQPMLPGIEWNNP